MPFDPTKPAFGSPDSSAEMRAQLNALNDKIDAQAAQIGIQAGIIGSILAQLNAAIAGTSSNTNGVGNLSLTITTNPTELFQVQPIADKLDELINALRR